MRKVKFIAACFLFLLSANVLSASLFVREPHDNTIVELDIDIIRRVAQKASFLRELIEENPPPGSSGFSSEIPEDLLSLPDLNAKTLRQFQALTIMAGITPEELPGLQNVCDYMGFSDAQVCKLFGKATMKQIKDDEFLRGLLGEHVEFVPIPSGKYRIGSPRSDPERYSPNNDGKTVEVERWYTVHDPVEIAKDPLSQYAYVKTTGNGSECTKETPSCGPNPSYFKNRDDCDDPSEYIEYKNTEGKDDWMCKYHPIEKVSKKMYEEKFLPALNRLTARMGYVFILAEEELIEVALWGKKPSGQPDARGERGPNDFYAHPPGNTSANFAQYAIFSGNSATNKHPHGQTHSITSTKTPGNRWYMIPNGFGLRLVGNVWFWTGSVYDINYTPGLIANDGSVFSIRGCGYISVAKVCRPAQRNGGQSGNVRGDLGAVLVRIPVH